MGQWLQGQRAGAGWVSGYKVRELTVGGPVVTGSESWRWMGQWLQGQRAGGGWVSGYQVRELALDGPVVTSQRAGAGWVSGYKVRELAVGGPVVTRSESWRWAFSHLTSCMSVACLSAAVS